MLLSTMSTYQGCLYLKWGMVNQRVKYGELSNRVQVQYKMCHLVLCNVLFDYVGMWCRNQYALGMFVLRRRESHLRVKYGELSFGEFRCVKYHSICLLCKVVMWWVKSMQSIHVLYLEVCKVIWRVCMDIVRSFGDLNIASCRSDIKFAIM